MPPFTPRISQPTPLDLAQATRKNQRALGVWVGWCHRTIPSIFANSISARNLLKPAAVSARAARVWHPSLKFQCSLPHSDAPPCNLQRVRPTAGRRAQGVPARVFALHVEVISISFLLTQERKCRGSNLNFPYPMKGVAYVVAPSIPPVGWDTASITGCRLNPAAQFTGHFYIV